jgi:EAL domain-containing protein (putative c-di-GMP-specific phosphodiesterase class I)
MSLAKESGRNNIQHFLSKMHDAAFLRLEIETGLRHALPRGELSLHYQPMTDISLQSICGVEALLRWRRDGGTPVPTQTFIPMAEETGMIIPIGEWVLQTACAQNRAWRDAGIPPMRMSVNVSPLQLAQGDIVRTIQKALDASGMPPDSLEIEITEGAIMKEVDRAMPLIRRIHDLGVHISIDDFGTGYSSLSYLRRFWIDTLKIDQSFVRDIASNLDDTSIVRAIITVAHSLDLNVIAEGIETTGQFYCLRSLGCNVIQGYLLSPPMPASDMAGFLRTGWSERIEPKENRGFDPPRPLPSSGHPFTPPEPLLQTHS